MRMEGPQSDELRATAVYLCASVCGAKYVPSSRRVDTADCRSEWLNCFILSVLERIECRL